MANVLNAEKLNNILHQMESDKTSNYEETILAFVDMIEQRDTYTAGHTIRVAHYCQLIAQQMKVSVEEIHRLEKAAILHDIGKVATPDAVLLKPGKLTPLEFELIKQHSTSGYNMLSKIAMYKDLAEIIKYHHSRYDGKGYPRTESPDEIPKLAHILILADAFDAMTTNRIYKPRKTVKETLEEVERLAGSQFHPDVVDAALIALGEVKVENKNQNPQTTLEYKRFSYFFQDALTEVYNDSYLQVLLSNENRAVKSLLYISLKNFSQFNKNNGWSKGNQFLIGVAGILKGIYVNDLVFRFEGDDFIVLSEHDIKDHSDEINRHLVLQATGVNVECSIQKLEKKSYRIADIL